MFDHSFYELLYIFVYWLLDVLLIFILSSVIYRHQGVKSHGIIELDLLNNFKKSIKGNELNSLW